MGKRFKRKIGKRKEYSFIYIFTEGKKTEPIYFKSKKNEIRSNAVKIEIKGMGYNTLSLVDYALNFVQQERIDLKIDECWVVFDKDDFNRNFNSAINKARKNGLKVAYSNEAFELWFLLHFSFMNSAIERDGYNKKIEENYIKETKNKKYKYHKTNGVLPLIDLIKDREKDAIRNAKKLLKQFKSEESFAKKNPSTTVHLLVERLNKLK
jgi:hypothetical protein